MKIATIGSGVIVNTFLAALQEVEGVECIAVYSRKEETAKSLAGKFNVNTIYTNFEEMAKNKEIDFIYIASPNSLHYEQAMFFMKHGKHIICEKALASNSREVEGMITYAKQHNLFFFEAITTIHLPNYKLIKEKLNEIGKIKITHCNFSQYSSRYDKLLQGDITNMFSLDFSGGSLMDLGIYNLHFIMNMFGEADKVNYFANKHSSGIDTSGVMLLQYPDFICECVNSKDSHGKSLIRIQGEKGYITINGTPNEVENFNITINGKDEEYNIQENSNRLYYQLVEFNKIYTEKNYKKCCELMDYSSTVYKTLTEARKDAGIIFPADK